ncbi:unnamed protein product [Ilex paraguariensis]|uniref:Uncharacterized protein n=1 Tax=Ilex paraguariensis TaxID=185542 RepID=A0ABC8UEK7_9AQUA
MNQRNSEIENELLSQSVVELMDCMKLQMLRVSSSTSNAFTGECISWKHWRHLVTRLTSFKLSVISLRMIMKCYWLLMRTITIMVHLLIRLMACCSQEFRVIILKKFVQSVLKLQQLETPFGISLAYINFTKIALIHG